MTEAPSGATSRRKAERFAHDADIGVRGLGATREAAFEEAAKALTGIVTDPARVRPGEAVDVECEAPRDDLLLVDWLNAIIYRMAVDRKLFSRFAVTIQGHHLRGRAWGERVDRARHRPAVEPKGATYTALKVECRPDGTWLAQCVVDV